MPASKNRVGPCDPPLAMSRRAAAAQADRLADEVGGTFTYLHKDQLNRLLQGPGGEAIGRGAVVHRLPMRCFAPQSVAGGAESRSCETSSSGYPRGWFPGLRRVGGRWAPSIGRAKRT